MGLLDRLKKFNCFDKVKGGIQARIENKTKHCLEAWLHAVPTRWWLTTQLVQITFPQKKKKLTNSVLQSSQLVSTIFSALSGVGHWHHQNKLHCCSFLYQKACQYRGAESCRGTDYLQTAELYPEIKLRYWRRAQQLDRYRAFKNWFCGWNKAVTYCKKPTQL